MNRRDFIKGSLLFLGFAGCANRSRPQTQGGYEEGSDHEAGHAVRDRRAYPVPTTTRKVRTAILGGGIAGLSAAWKLRRSGWSGVEIFELEEKPGGNSRFVEYPPSLAPIAAHYLPIPTQESRAVIELLTEMNLMRLDERGAPVYDERHLCHPEVERLWFQGRWHDGLGLVNGVSESEQAQWAKFQAEVAEWQAFRDSEGRKAFAIPLAESSRAPELMALDRISFGQYATERGYTAEFVRWLLEYATRDDYGAGLDSVSAWAGLHYFAARDGGGFRASDAQFVWPEGNGHLTSYLASTLESPITTRHLVRKVVPGSPVVIDLYDLGSKTSLRVEAESCVYCLPSFQRPYHMEEAPLEAFQYAPWVTANLVLERSPREMTEFSEPAWDNVVYGSDSLGYVKANHQTKARSNSGPNVWTWYRPFPNLDPSKVRQELLAKPWSHWRDTILADLQLVHPDIEEVTRRIDVAVLGHAMIVPSVGFIWGEQAEKAREAKENLWFAHSDLSGMSIFEEAQYRGVLAAQQLMTAKGHPFTSSA